MEIKREGTNKTERERALRDIKSRKNECGGEKDAKVWVVKKKNKKTETIGRVGQTEIMKTEREESGNSKWGGEEKIKRGAQTDFKRNEEGKSGEAKMGRSTAKKY